MVPMAPSSTRMRLAAAARSSASTGDRSLLDSDMQISPSLIAVAPLTLLRCGLSICHPSRAPSGARAGTHVLLSRFISETGRHGSRIGSLCASRRSPSGMTTREYLPDSHASCGLALHVGAQPEQVADGEHQVGAV